MSDLEILSLGYWKGQDTEPRYKDEATKERWNELLAPYSEKARSVIADAAAHSADVLMYKGQLVIVYRSWDGIKQNHAFIISKDGTGQYAPPCNRLPDEEINKLYDLRTRRF